MKYASINGRAFCFIAKGRLKHNEAVKQCKSLNARLPLPRNKKEYDDYKKVMGKDFAHADARCKSMI